MEHVLHLMLMLMLMLIILMHDIEMHRYLLITLIKDKDWSVPLARDRGDVRLA